MFKKKREPMLTEETDMNTRFSDFLRNFKKQKTAVVAFFVLIILMLVAIFCYKIAPYGINEYNYDAMLQGPSAYLERMNLAGIFSAECYAEQEFLLRWDLLPLQLQQLSVQSSVYILVITEASLMES